MDYNKYFTKERELWIQQRKGKFSASEIHKLFVGGKRPMTEEELEARPKGPRGGLLDRSTTIETMFGEGALSYIQCKIDELLSNIDLEESALENARQIKWGIDMEHEAVEHFKRITGLSVIYHGAACPVFHQYGDFAGGSPDGDIIDENAILEIKCPFNTSIHTKRLFIKSIEEFKQCEWDAYCQCQMNMKIMKREYAYYGSYDPRKTYFQHKMKIVKIKSDLAWQDEFDMRLEAAIEEMVRMIQETEKYLVLSE